MNPKSKDASIRERLDYIARSRDFSEAEQLVVKGRLGLQQKEAEAWLREEKFKRHWWKAAVSIVTVAAGVATVVEVFS